MTDLKIEERIPVLSWSLRIAVSATVAVSVAFIAYAMFTRTELQRSFAELERPFAKPNLYEEFTEGILRGDRLTPRPPDAPSSPPPMPVLTPAGEAKLKAFAEASQMSVSQARALYGWQFEKEYGRAPEGENAVPPPPEPREVLRNADWSNVINPALRLAFAAFVGTLIVTSLISYFATERHLGWIRLSIALSAIGIASAIPIGMAQEASFQDTLLLTALISLVGLLAPTTVRRVMRWIRNGFGATSTSGEALQTPEGSPPIVWRLTGSMARGLVLTSVTVLLISAGSILFPQMIAQVVMTSLACVVTAALALGASGWSKRRRERL
jgi:hypothetical protein